VALSTIPKPRGGGILGGEERRALGSEIRRLRTARGLTQQQLAEPLTRAYVCSVEHGRAIPSLASLVLFARRLDVPLAKLVGPLESSGSQGTTEGFTPS
jgi:transcriptional regulator with XRE-family HTH domain